MSLQKVSLDTVGGQELQHVPKGCAYVAVLVQLL